jgi:hypothetical protein
VVDAASEIDAPTCNPLLDGSKDITAQGWSIIQQAPAALTYGADYVRLETKMGKTTSGQLLLTRAGAIEPGKPFKLQVTMLVESVNDHNGLDAAAAIMGSFTAPFGMGNDRPQMLYLDSGAIGWADDSLSFPFTVTDNAYHLYELSVDAVGVATVSVDGSQALTRKGFTTNGTIAIGDQTNDPNVDAAIRIKSVVRPCL